jgi:hypothetical protein
MLTELDVSGLKNISAVSLQQLLDTKLAQVKPHKISDLLNSFFLLALVCGRLQDFYLTFMLVSRLIVELISIQLSHDSRKYTQMTGNL